MLDVSLEFELFVFKASWQKKKKKGDANTGQKTLDFC